MLGNAWDRTTDVFLYLVGGIVLGWLIGFAAAAIISFWVSLVVKGICKLIKFIRY